MGINISWALDMNMFILECMNMNFKGIWCTNIGGIVSIGQDCPKKKIVPRYRTRASCKKFKNITSNSFLNYF